MSLTIVGAGAIGGTLGAYLAREGVDVTFVDRDADHVDAMNAHGLTIEGFAETFTVPVRALRPDQLSGPLETVLLAVKAQHTEEAARMLTPHLAADGAVVSLQNGLCEKKIAEIVGAQRTVGCFVNFSADYLEPGRIHYGGPGALYLGELDGHVSERLAALKKTVRPFCEATLTDNIWGYLWGKLGYANMLFATALCDATMAESIDRYRRLMVELACEMYEAAEREAVHPEPFDAVQPDLYYPRQQQDWQLIDASLDALVARRQRDKKTRSGIWRDLAVRRRRTEVDEQIGLAAEIGRQHGLTMPLTTELVRQIHELESGARERSEKNLEKLENLRREVQP